jgi:hypothetical protein
LEAVCQGAGAGSLYAKEDSFLILLGDIFRMK